MTDIEERLRRQENHTFCKELLAEKRKEYKCPQKLINALKDCTGNRWHIYIDPEGLVGCFSGCCKWEAMIKALERKFTS